MFKIEHLIYKIINFCSDIFSNSMTSRSVGNGGNQMMDLMKANMLMNSKDNPVYTFIVMTFLEVIMKYVSQIIEIIKKFVDKWMDRKFNRVVDSLPLDGSSDAKCEILFDRNFSKNQKIEEYTKVDAILMRVVEIPEIKRMIFSRARYMVNYKDPIMIKDGIKFQLIENTFDNDGDIEVVKFRIFCANQDAQNLKTFIARCEVDYEMIKKNKLGNDLFFFDQILLSSEQKSNDLIPDKIMFSRNLFLTNRTLDNVFFEQKPEVLTRLDLFENHVDWYNRRGIPHTLGFLLYGCPGSGKTSTIKAIANMTQRHIININFGKIKSKRQLKQLFYDEKIWVMEKADVGENLDSYIIPIHKRLYVLEDLDAVDGSPLLRREIDIDSDESDSDEKELEDYINRYKKETNFKKIEAKKLAEEEQREILKKEVEKQKLRDEMKVMMQNMVESKAAINHSSSIGPNEVQQPQNQEQKPSEKKEDDDKLDLSAVLNILDGTLETPGRMLIITSNYPEKLDQALIRPGRIDLILEFKKANHQLITEMYRCYFEQDPDPKLVEQIKEYLWSPAELGQILFKNYDHPEKSLTDLIENTPESYFKFSYFNRFDDD